MELQGHKPYFRLLPEEAWYAAPEFLHTEISSPLRAREELLPLAHAFLGDGEDFLLSGVGFNKDRHSDNVARDVVVEVLPAELLVFEIRFWVAHVKMFRTKA